MAEGIRVQAEEAGHRVAEIAHEVGDRVKEGAEDVADWVKQKERQFEHRNDDSTDRTGHEVGH